MIKSLAYGVMESKLYNNYQMTLKIDCTIPELHSFYRNKAFYPV